MVDKKQFMQNHMDELIQRIREPIQLADALFAKKLINNEMYEKIKANVTKLDKTREIFACLNTKKLYVFTYNCLKEHENHLIKELEKCDAKARKRARQENEDDKDDSLEGFPDFKMACTFAKLEKWLSTPEISQKLMSNLEKKIYPDGMANLETELKRKEPKNILCFNANNIDKIRSNVKLRTFIREKGKTIFPSLTYEMFFKKGGSATIKQCHDEAVSQIINADTPSQISMDMHDTYTEEMEEQTQSSNLAVHKERHQNEHIIKGETPIEYTHGSMIKQETNIHKMKEQPQRFNVPNALRHQDESLDQDDQIITKEKIFDDGLGSMDMQDTHIDDEMDDDILPSQNEQITSKETSLDEGLGSMDMHVANTDAISEELRRPPVPRQEDRVGSKDVQDTYTEGIKEEHQTSNIANVPSHGDKSLLQNEPITKKETSVDNGTGSTDKKEMHIEEINEEPLGSNSQAMLQNDLIIKANMQLDDSENVNMQQSQPADSEVIPEPLSSKHLQPNSPVSASENTQIIGTEILEQNKDTPMQARKKDLKATKKREMSQCQKKKEMDKLLRDWAETQCNEKELKNIFDNISIINMAEHNEYPCFTAENVMVYKYLTPESQILFVTDDNTSINTMTIVQYQMFVCDIKKAIILGPKKPQKQEIQYNKSEVPIIRCKSFIFQAFAPALVVYKKIQKEQKLYSLI